LKSKQTLEIKEVMFFEQKYQEYSLVIPGCLVIDNGGDVAVRKKCKHFQVENKEDKFYCTLCTVEVSQCLECWKLFSPKTIEKYGGCCGRCFKELENIRYLTACMECGDEFESENEDQQICPNCILVELPPVSPRYW
jgi:DNA-directed RNA polymerase subunit RPC12/RpoP